VIHFEYVKSKSVLIYSRFYRQKDKENKEVFNQHFLFLEWSKSV